MEVGPPSSASSSSPLSPSSPTLEERRRPGTLFIWQERERLQQQQREKARYGSVSQLLGTEEEALHAVSNGLDTHIT